jgi:hypothetical protein
MQADANLCDNLPGHWQGTFTIKDPELCKIFDGCTHQIKAHVCPDNFFADTNFEVNVNPSAGVAQFFYIACYNEVISSPYGFSGKITASCDLTGNCEMIYEDSKLLCKMLRFTALPNRWI